MRKINRAVKIRIYPNKEQIAQIEKTIGCSRFLYNWMLADKIRYYQEEKKMLKNTPAGYKKEYPWLKEVDSLALANVQLNLEGAFRKFFREPSGKYFVSLLSDCENQTAEKRQAEKFLGIDFAMHGMCVFSTGERAGYPMFYRNAEKKLAREQRKLSRCEKGSRNYQKQKKKVVLYHEKIKNQRKDFQHKLSHSLAEDYDAVCVEDLNLKGMACFIFFFCPCEICASIVISISSEKRFITLWHLLKEVSPLKTM